MKRPRWRFTLRGMMVAVAILALASFGTRMLIRRGQHLRSAVLFQKKEAEARQREAWSRSMATKGYVSPRVAEAERSRAEHFGRMKAKYERAARSPWLAVEPDPPAAE
ncbi:hypothetical protein TA3x_001802 [Tundrisphaera sp. TA3]|uniref:hypothetical protein n=1 Tax=Tundrisphaera sp. TA3 TaxID=3435775 RepID=UPI003EBDF614